MSYCDNTRKQLKAAVKSLDIYGKPIQLTYKGRDAFRTVTGGLFSSLILITMSTYLVYCLFLLITYGKTNLQVNTVIGYTNAWAPPEIISNMKTNES